MAWGGRSGHGQRSSSFGSCSRICWFALTREDVTSTGQSHANPLPWSRRRMGGIRYDAPPWRGKGKGGRSKFTSFTDMASGESHSWQPVRSGHRAIVSRSSADNGRVARSRGPTGSPTREHHPLSLSDANPVCRSTVNRFNHAPGSTLGTASRRIARGDRPEPLCRLRLRHVHCSVGMGPINRVLGPISGSIQ